MRRSVKKPTKINVILIMGLSMILCVPGFKSGIQDSFEYTNQSLVHHMHVHVQCLYAFLFFQFKANFVDLKEKIDRAAMANVHQTSDIGTTRLTVNRIVISYCEDDCF